MPETKSIHEALLAVQENMPDIGLDTQGQIGSRSYKYASLPVILGIVLPILQAQGIVLIQRPTVQGEMAVLETILHHVASKSEVIAHTPLPIPTDWQAWGSAVTYARRYSLLPMLGIAPDEDDDAASAQGYSQAPRQASVARTATPAGEHGVCPEHNVPYFKRGNMTGPAHPTDAGPWCNKPEDAPSEGDTALKKAVSAGILALSSLYTDAVQQKEWVAEMFPELAGVSMAEYTLEDWDGIISAAQEPGDTEAGA